MGVTKHATRKNQLTRGEVLDAIKQSRSIFVNVQLTDSPFGFHSMKVNKTTARELLSKSIASMYYAEVIGDALFIGETKAV